MSKSGRNAGENIFYCCARVLVGAVLAMAPVFGAYAASEPASTPAPMAAPVPVPPPLPPSIVPAVPPVSKAVPVPDAVPVISTVAKQAIIIDFNTGVVLFQKDADQRMPPSSMSKLMTTYALFAHLRAGNVTFDTLFNVSEYAKKTSEGGSRTFLETGQNVRVEDLLRGIIIQSGNDASIVVAEGLANSETAFAGQLTQLGQQIGLKNSTFQNATGLPAPEHLMTARDLAHLAQRLIVDFPEYFHYYAEQSFTFNKITQKNRNPLLGKVVGADGLKTGHTQAAGYGLVGTAQRNGHRIILVLNGLVSEKQREDEAARLIEQVYRDFSLYSLFRAGEVVENAEVWLGKEKSVPLVASEDITITIPFAARPDMKVSVIYNGPLAAPIMRGAPVARLVITVPGMDPIERTLVAGEDVGKVGVGGKIWASLRYMLSGNDR